MENVQGLPLCTCPSSFLCQKRRRRGQAVCGVDGQTYQSMCYLRIAMCNKATKIRVAHEGSCYRDHKNDDVKRPVCESFSRCLRRRNQQIVCGTDGKTYLSRCHLKTTACQEGRSTKVYTEGACSIKRTHRNSRTVFSMKDIKNANKIAKKIDQSKRHNRSKQRTPKQNGNRELDVEARRSLKNKTSDRNQVRQRRKKNDKRRKRRIGHVKNGHRPSHHQQRRRVLDRKTFDSVKNWSY